MLTRRKASCASRVEILFRRSRKTSPPTSYREGTRSLNAQIAVKLNHVIANIFLYRTGHERRDDISFLCLPRTKSCVVKRDRTCMTNLDRRAFLKAAGIAAAG